LSDMLDWIDDTHGAVLYRDSAGWAALAPGADGDVLTTHGAGADPTWETPSAGGGGVWTQIVSSTAIPNPSAQIDVTGLSGYSEIMFMARNVTASSAGFRIIQAGKAGVFYNTPGNYKGISTSTGAESNASDWGGNGSSTTAAATIVTRILNNSTGVPVSYQAASVPILFVAVAGPIDALRYKNTAGNLTGGTYEVWGRP
jgi:hypothetical protein